MSVQVKGMLAVIAAFDGVNAEAERAVKRVVRKTAVRVEGRAKELVPVDTGRLRSSITHEIDASGFSGTVGTNVEYARDVEFGRMGGDLSRGDLRGLAGWMNRKGIEGASRRRRIVTGVASHGTRAQPYLFPAWEQNRKQFLDELTAVLGRLVVRGGGYGRGGLGSAGDG